MRNYTSIFCGRMIQMGAVVLVGNLVYLTTVGGGQEMNTGHQTGQAECFSKFSLSEASEKNSLKAGNYIESGQACKNSHLPNLTRLPPLVSARMLLTLSPFSKYLVCILLAEFKLNPKM